MYHESLMCHQWPVGIQEYLRSEFLGAPLGQNLFHKAFNNLPENTFLFLKCMKGKRTFSINPYKNVLRIFISLFNTQNVMPCFCPDLKFR